MREIVRTLRQMTAQGALRTIRRSANGLGDTSTTCRRSAARTHVTDKNPLNIESVGLIMRLLPHALVLHVRRDPLEKLSIRLPAGAEPPLDLCAPAAGHRALLPSRRTTRRELGTGIPGSVLTLQYEEFVRNFSTAAPALLDACGLRWEPQCLTFQNYRARSPA
jgi:hypothetical protein